MLGSRPAWHVCCRRPLDAALVLERLASTGTPFTADFHLASSRQLMPQVAAYLPRAEAVFVNAAELAHLSAAVGLRGLRLVVASDGPQAATTIRNGRPSASVVPPAVTPAEVTGAGDILAGTFLAAMSRGLGDQEALALAVTAATAAVTRPGLGIPAGTGG